MSEDQDDPDIRAGKLHKDLESVVEEMFDLVSEGHRRWLDEAHLILVQGKIEGLRDYMRMNRAA